MGRIIDYSILPLLPVLVFTTITAASAQSATDQIALGDKEYAARHLPSALAHYEMALAKDSNSYVALWRAAEAGIEVAEYNPNPAEQASLYKTAEQRARRAIQINPTDAEGHDILALALDWALTKATDMQKQAAYAKEIHDEALACLRINPKHPDCLHTMGMWHAGIMSLSVAMRTLAGIGPNGELFKTASWDEAQKCLVTAAKIEPRSLIHWLDLGRIYVGRGMKARARTAFQNVLKGGVVYYNDPHYKAAARKALHDL